MRGPRLLLVVACLVAAVCLLARLGELPLIAPDEGRNAEVAREMKDSGAWLVPTYDGLAYLDKPAFYFRLVALSMSALGESETAARLPAALFALGLLALVYGFTRRAYGDRAAALAVLVVGTTPLVVAFARIVIFDMVLAFFVTAAVLAGYVAEEKEGAARARWYLLGAASSAVATLVKGPVGFILPPLVLMAFNALDRRRGAIRRLFAPLNLLVFFAIVLPWFLGVAHQRPDFPYYGLVEESLHRFTSPQFHRTAPFWYYVPVIAGVFFPWSILLPESVAAAWKARDRWLRADRLLVAWVLVAVVFFSLSQSKLPGYVLTAVVALGILTARVLDLAFRQPAGRAGLLVWRAGVALTLISLAGAVVLAVARAGADGLPGLLRMHAGDLERLQPATALLMWSLIAVAAAAAFALWRRDLRVLCTAFALPPLLLLTVGFEGARAYTEGDSSRQLSRQLPSLAGSVEIACLECLPNGLPFYLRRTVTIITRDGSETTSNYVVFSLRRSAAWPAGVVPLGSRDAWLATRSHPIYLMARSDRRAALDSVATRHGVSVTSPFPGWWAALLPPPPAPAT
jgi:4-amino-4-deoxy-L-arabinose transferase-like glycosyltransferase